MPNPDYNDMNGRKQGAVKAKGTRPGSAAEFGEKDAGFPGVPGKTAYAFPKAGATKCKIHPKSEGLC